jgi:hypothetical protein
MKIRRHLYSWDRNQPWIIYVNHGAVEKYKKATLRGEEEKAECIAMGMIYMEQAQRTECEGPPSNQNYQFYRLCNDRDDAEDALRDLVFQIDTQDKLQLREPAGRIESRCHSVSPKLRYRILRRDGFRCQLCGRSADDNVILHVDHKQARANGGSNDESNLWVLCADCNMGKGATDL